MEFFDIKQENPDPLENKESAPLQVEEEYETNDIISQKLKNNEYTFGTKRKGRSPVWVIFREVRKPINETWIVIKGVIGCTVCLKVHKFVWGSYQTSNLLQHKCVKNFKNGLPKSSLVCVDDDTKKQLSDAITNYAIEDHVPFLSVSGAGFQKLIKLVLKIGHKHGTEIDIDHLLSNAQDNYEIYKQYQFDSSRNESKCLVENCNQSVNGRVLDDLKHHLNSMHQSLAAELIDEHNTESSFEPTPSLLTAETESVDSFTNSNSNTVQSQPNKLSKLDFDENLLIRGCIKMVIDNNLSFDLFNSEGFQMIVNPITAALGSTVSSVRVLEKILAASFAIKAQIRLELQGRIFCLKADAVTKNGKSFMALSAQFLEGVDIKVRTLCLLELVQLHTRDYLKNQIVNFLEKNCIQMTQIYSIIVDNATSNTKNFTKSDSEEIREEDDYIDDNILVLLETHPINFINPERCMAHNLQLVASDIIKLYEAEVKAVRKIVCKMIQPEYQQYFVDEPTVQPIKDVETRPMTTYLMIKNIRDNMSFYKNLFNDPDAELTVEPNVLVFIDHFTAALEPLYVAVKKCSEEQIIIGDFLVIWLQCKMDCRKFGTKYVYTKFLLEIMDLRQSQLFDSAIFRAALYMDPRFNFSGSKLLSPLQKNAAKDFIFRTWTSMRALDPAQSSTDMDVDTTVSSVSSELDKFFEAECSSLNADNDETVADIDIKQKISNLCKSNKVPLATNVLQMWKWKQYDEPELFNIAQIVLSVPSTQVTVNRVIGAHELLISYSSQKLPTETIGNIMMTKLNSELVESIQLS